MTRLLVVSALLLGLPGYADQIDLNELDSLKLHNVVVASVRYKGKQGLEVKLAPAEVDQAPAAAGEANRRDALVIVDEGFTNGTIEVTLSGQPAAGAGAGARGFVGIAFRVQPDLRTYDAFYLRPTNGRAEDQVRRNHSAQYVSHPDYTWSRLRQETPGKYESYVDLMPGEWTKVRIVVEGSEARLFVHGAEQPTVIVRDLKTGAAGSGAVAVWIEGSTLAHFTDLRITSQ